MASLLELPSPCLVVLVGIAGSGKSTWAKANFEAHQIVSSDALRALVGEGEGDQNASKDAFALLDDVVRRRLSRRLTTVIDTLGLDASRRKGYLAVAAQHGVPCVAVVIDVNAAGRIRRQNRARQKRVPERIVSEQIASWPDVLEQLADEDFAAVHRVAIVEQSDIAQRPVERTTALVPASLARPPKQRMSAATDHSAARTAPANERLRFGLQLSRFDLRDGPSRIGERLAGIAKTAEAVGFDSIWVMDHFRQIPQVGRPWDDMLESYTALTYMAAVTTTIRVGTLVTGITYRNVGHLAKIIATLDVLSAGRANCGIGLGWYQQEHEAYGWTFPTVRERYALLEDALQLLPAMWAPGTKPFTGRVLRIPETMCYPRPLQAHIPILVGGSGERSTLRLVARYADACNLFGEAPQVIGKLAALRRHCDDFARDPSEIEMTHLSTVLAETDLSAVRAAVERLKPPSVSAERFAISVHAGTAEQHADRMSTLFAAGVQTAIVSLADLQDSEAVERFGEVIARFR